MFNNDYYFIALFRYKPLKPLNKLNETPPNHARNAQRLILMFANSDSFWAIPKNFIQDFNPAFMQKTANPNA